MKLLELYESLLKVGGFTVTMDGFISAVFNNKNSPAMLNGKRLVMPMQEHLANPKPNEQIIFHPLSENMMRGESEVLNYYRSGVNKKINYTVGVIVSELLAIAASVKEHSKLNPDQAEILSVLKDVDEKTIELFNKILGKMPADQHNATFVHIYLKKKGGTVGETKFGRVGVVSFPLYSELKEPSGANDEIYGVKARVKDRESLIKLMEYIFPLIDQAEGYNRGTNSQIAPNLDVLMQTIMAVTMPINNTIDLFDNIFDDPEMLVLESGWVNTFENLNVMLPEIRKIPMQAGNEGIPVVSNTNQAVTIIPPTQLPQNQMVAYVNPQQAYIPQQQGIVKTAGGLDFTSLENNIAALRNPGGGMQSGMGGGGRDPSWATPQFNLGGHMPNQGQNPFGNHMQPQQWNQQQVKIGGNF